MNRKKQILIAALVGILAYPVAYCVLRSTKFLVRREWVEFHPHSRTHQREIYASDVGHMPHFDSDFNPRRDPFPVLFFPLWQVELRLRGKYFHHDKIVVIHVDLLEPNKHLEHISDSADAV
jgi:hypothetical protein